MKYRRRIILFLFTLLAWFALSNMAFNLYVSYERNQLINEIKEQLPQGNHYSASSRLSSALNEIELIGMSSNNEFVYKLPDHIWFMQYFENQTDKPFKFGQMYPVQIISKNQIQYQDEIKDILNQVSNQEETRYTRNDNLYEHNQKLYNIINTSIFTYKGYPTSRYVNVGSCKVLVIDDGDYKEFNPDTEKGKAIRNDFYKYGAIIMGFIFIILFVLMEDYDKIHITKENQRDLIIGLCILSLVVGLLYVRHSIIESDKKEFYNTKRYETKIRHLFPIVESMANNVQLIKGTELDYINNYFVSYMPEVSIHQAYNAFYDNHPDFMRAKILTERQMMFLAGGSEGGDPFYDGNDKLLQNCSNFSLIRLNTWELLKMDVLEVSSEAEMYQYIAKCDSLTKEIDSLKFKFIEDNREILER